MKYYEVETDFKAYPDAWLYEAHSARSVGKTYGALKYCYQNNIKMLYLKRTQIDIELIINNDLFSPYKPINRDLGTNIQFCKVYDGIASITEDDKLLGYAMAMSAIHKYKGFDLSDVGIMIVDEFIPQLSERVNRKEGELLLDLYMTVSRDREARGHPPLKLVLFANATELYCPITETLQIIDELSELNSIKMEEGEHTVCKYLEDRGILLRKLEAEEEQTEMAVYKGMRNTKWAQMAFGGKFAYNDFSRIKKIPLKGMICHIELQYNNNKYYIYQHRDNGLYYMCSSPSKPIETYDFDIEADQRRFYLTWSMMLKNEVSDGNMFFEKYTGYNLIYNFTKVFKL